MGNILFADSRGEDDFENSNEIDYYLFDTFTKKEIVEYAKKLKPSGLQVDDNFAEQLKDLDLVCMTLLAMNIEFYDKASAIVPKYKPEKGIKYSITKPSFVKPKFGPEKIADDTSRAHLDLSQFDAELNLGEKPDPSVPYRTGKITLNEFNEAFRNPTNNKDLFGISKKVLSAMPNFHKQRLINIYNKLYSGECDPQDISLGRACYLYKEAKHGKTDDLSSFRQIISIPKSTNHFHRIIALRMNEFLAKNNFINTTIQKGSVSVSNGILEQIYKVKQVVKGANKNNKECAIMFMDISNAFGNINLDRLYDIMRKYHIEEELIEYIQNFYDGFEYYVQTKEWSTDLKKWEGGLMQGCPLSPTLFVLVMDYILTYLDDKYKDEYGYSLEDDIKILFTAFVDDVCIICKDMESLNTVFERVKFLLNSVGLPINLSKCSYMSINPSKQDSTLKNIPCAKVHKYLGEYISSDGSSSESYTKFMAMLSKKLFSLDRKKVDNATKIKFFSKCMLPWIQRKLMVMYDVSRDEKKKIVSIIKKYLLKWGSEEEIHIFTFIADLLIDSTDEVINKIEINTEFDDALKEEIELVNNSFQVTNYNISYSKVNAEPKVEDANEADVMKVANQEDGANSD